jgi:hypothetical protein
MTAPMMPFVEGLEADGAAKARIGRAPAMVIWIAFSDNAKKRAWAAFRWQRRLCSSIQSRSLLTDSGFNSEFMRL